MPKFEGGVEMMILLLVGENGYGIRHMLLCNTGPPYWQELLKLSDKNGNLLGQIWMLREVKL